MRQEVASYVQQAVCVRRKENEQKKHEIPPNTNKTHYGTNPQQPGDRDHLETACDDMSHVLAHTRTLPP